MFFDDINEIPKIASRVGTAIFVVPKDFEVEIPGALTLRPEEKSVITIEQVRDIISILAVKQTTERYIVIRPAELMNPEAANAFLKNLEEPKEKVHFVLITDSPSSLLSTILSRAEIYFLRQKVDFREILAEAKVKDLAKRLMTAKPAELPALAEEIAKKKDGVRAYALEVVGIAIEMLYKSYFLTSKEVFLAKLPKFLRLYENLARNGHVKLQIVSCLC